MYAKYIKKEMPDLNGVGQTQVVYSMKKTPMDFDTFVNLCCREGSMSRDAIIGVLSLVTEKLALSMAEGYSVRLGDIGTFSAKLGVRGDVLPETFEPGTPKHNARDIRVTGVNYRAGRDFIAMTNDRCYLVKDGESRIRKPGTTLTERVALARQYLEKHHMMNVGDYRRLTGLSQTTASMELRRIVQDPASGITYTGSRSQKRYVLRENANF